MRTSRNSTRAVRRTDREGPVEQSVIRLFQGLGWFVAKTSAHMHAKGVSKGTPDLYVLAGTLGSFWFEAKAPGGKQSEAQFDFMTRCEESGVIYALGGLDEAYDVLEHFGIGERIPGTIRIYPRDQWPHTLLSFEAAEAWYTNNKARRRAVLEYGHRAGVRSWKRQGII